MRGGGGLRWPRQRRQGCRAAVEEVGDGRRSGRGGRGRVRRRQRRLRQVLGGGGGGRGRGFGGGGGRGGRAEEAGASGEDDGEASSRRSEEALGHGWKDKVGEVGWWAIWAVLDLSFPFKAH